MANDTIIRGSDIDIKITLTYDSKYITDGVTFEISYFDSYNHGKIWKYEVPESSVTTQGNTFVVRFPADKQKFNGYHNVRCIVKLSEDNTQQVVFKHAFYLNDPILPNAESVELTAVVEASAAALTGSLVVCPLIRSVSYDADKMLIYIVFTNGTGVTIDARQIFPFRVMSDVEWESTATIEDNMFYYVYESPFYIDDNGVLVIREGFAEIVDGVLVFRDGNAYIDDNGVLVLR